MNVVEYVFDNKAEESKLALLTLDHDYTYADLKHGIQQVSSYLLRHGARKGDRVALIAESSYFWVVAYLGTLCAGCVVVPMPTNIPGTDCAYILESTRCRWGFVQGRYAKTYLPLMCDAGITLIIDEATLSGAAVRQVTLFSDLLSQTRVHTHLAPVEVDDRLGLAALMFTSGSTGKPRGVMVSHRNIIANTNSIIAYLDLMPRDRIMAVLPFFYCFGTSLLHTHLRVGGSVVVDTRFIFPDKVLKRMQELHCTGFAGVPSTYQLLLNNSSLAKMQFPALTTVQQAGGKLSNTYIMRLRKALPTTRVFVMYGQTEATARLSYLPPEMLDTKLGSIGKGIPGVTLEVLDTRGQPAPPGEIGEIVAQGENITLGYWQSPEETKQSFQDGKLYTGDLAKRDEDGYIYIVDRAKDFLKCGGYRVSCMEIEEVILRFDGVVEAAVIGQPDETLGEAVRLYVVHPDGESTYAELQQYCITNFRAHLVPKTILFKKALPKTMSGKVDKLSLKQELLEGQSYIKG